MAIIPFTNAYHLMPDPVFSPPPTIFQAESPETFLGSKKITPLRVEERNSRGTVASLLQEWANREASCALSIAGGALGSAATHNPLPLVWGLSDCLTTALAIPVVNHTIPNYVTDWQFNLNYQVANDTFYDTEDAALVYSSSLANGKSLPAQVKFDPSTRTFSGSISKTIKVRVFAKNPSSEEAYTDFEFKINSGAVVFMGLFFGAGLSYLGIKCGRYLCNRLSPPIDYRTINSPAPIVDVPAPSHAMSINEADEEELIALLPSNEIVICMICREMMSDPVILPDKKRIDRSCIQHYYNIGGRFCPETRVPLPDPTTLPTDAVLKKVIEDFKKSKLH